MISVFCDANILISYFRSSPGDLRDVDTLVSAARVGLLSLETTDLLHSEYKRYREQAIGKSLELFDPSSINTLFPPYAKKYRQAEEAADLIHEAKRKLGALKREIVADAKDGRLYIDETINDYFRAARFIRVSDEIFCRADRRSKLGNPPRANGTSIGDAINWECLLTIAPMVCDLVLITEDGDFASDLSRCEPKEFLAEEWQSKTNGGRLALFRRIDDFLKLRLPDARAGMEQEAVHLIGRLQSAISNEDVLETIEQLRSSRGFSSQVFEDLVKFFENREDFASCLKSHETISLFGDAFESFGATLDRKTADFVLEVIGGHVYD